jgi:hypothetical protein
MRFFAAMGGSGALAVGAGKFLMNPFHNEI